MTGTKTAATPRPATSTTSMSPSAQQIWRRVRGVLLALAILLAAGIALAAVRSGDQHGRLDPRSADPLGSRAVAELLKDRGVSTRVVTTLAEATEGTGPDTTLVVTQPNLLTFQQQRTLQDATEISGGRTVLLSPGPFSLDILAPGVTAAADTPVDAREPRCSLPAARDAGSVDIGGYRYATDPPNGDACYPTDGLPSFSGSTPRPAATPSCSAPPISSTTSASPNRATPRWPFTSSAPGLISSGTSPHSVIPPPPNPATAVVTTTTLTAPAARGTRTAEATSRASST